MKRRSTYPSSFLEVQWWGGNPKAGFRVLEVHQPPLEERWVYGCSSSFANSGCHKLGFQVTAPSFVITYSERATYDWVLHIKICEGYRWKWTYFDKLVQETLPNFIAQNGPPKKHHIFWIHWKNNFLHTLIFNIYTLRNPLTN